MSESSFEHHYSNHFNNLDPQNVYSSVDGVDGPGIADKKGMQGTFYVAKSGKYTWRVMVRTYQDGGHTTKTVPKMAWPELGFSPTMTLEQASARARQLNAQAAVERNHTAKVSRVARRMADDQLSHSAFIPEELNQQFLEYLDDNTSVKGHLKARSHWARVKKMIIQLQIRPEDFAEHKKKIYKYFTAQEVSPAYVKKLLRILNLYGKFTGRLSKVYYDPVPNPKGHDREMINDAYLDSDGYFGPSEPLSPETLESLKDQLTPEQHSWLTISVWLGLRPSEIDSLSSQGPHQAWRLEPGDPDVLWVYQSKLTSKPRHLRWKPIPILFAEQREALALIYKGGAAKPLARTLKRLTKRQITLYAGRKGFTDLMLERGQKLEDVAQWMGHSSIEMTWTKYKDRSRVHFTKLK